MTRDRGDESLWFRAKAVEGIILCLTSDCFGEFCRIGSFACGGHAGMSREEALRGNSEYELFKEVLERQGGEAAERVCGGVVGNEESGAEKYVNTVT